MSREKIEMRFDDLFLRAIGISMLDLEWMLETGDDEALRQQEANVTLLLEIAYDRGLRDRPELAEAIAEIKRNGLAYRDVMRRYQTVRIAKSARHRYLDNLSGYHDAMVSDCRRLCQILYPSGLRRFDLCFGAI
jgi:hypothetical protein